MTICFHKVTPAPLAGVIDVRTDIWGKDPVFESGKKHRVVAPSGKGKTTFMHLIYGLRSDYDGEIDMDEVRLRSMNSDQWTALRRDKFSIVFQDLRLFLRLTALENINVKAALHQLDVKDKIHRMANTLQVSHVLDKPCQTLSYGERQRVAIIRALIQPFEWIFLDEPFSHLDKENAQKAAELIGHEVQERNAGLIITALGEEDHFGCDHQFQL